MIAWPAHDKKTLGDLVKSLLRMPEEDQIKVWDLIDEWSWKAGEAEKAELRECIRQFAFTRRGWRRKLGETTRDRARKAYDSLQPHDPVIRHAWLFVKQWVQESADEIEDEGFDYRKRHEWIDRLRHDSMVEVWTERGFEGVRELLVGSDAAAIVGHYAASCVTDVKLRIDFIRSCLCLDADLRNKAGFCLQGFLGTIEESSRAGVLRATAEGLSAEDCARLLVCAPFQASTWRLLDSYDEGIRAVYWRDALPSFRDYTHAELAELIDRLLEARRPRAAFQAAHMNFEHIETSRLKRLLHDIATVNTEPPDHFELEVYYISEALDSLDGRPDITREEMAQLEFLFVGALDDSKHGIPNIENLIAESPEVFVQAVAFGYKRSDEGDDPPEWRIENSEQRAAIASASHHLLDQIKKIPGTNESGSIDAAALAKWLSEARRLCREYGRADIGDHCLGQLLAKAPEDEKGVWPCEAVCAAMEEIAAPEIGKGFYIGVRNSRGVHFRKRDGGEQERELAIKYRALAERLHFDYPYVGGILAGIAASYERDARHEDSEAEIMKRLRH